MERIENEWSSDKLELIFGYLFEAQEENFPIILWQEERNKKIYFGGQIRTVHINKIFIKLSPIKDDSTPLNKLLPIHISITGFYQAIHFQSPILFITQNVVIISMPTKLKLWDRKEQPIPYYENSEYNRLTFRLKKTGNLGSSVINRIFCSQILKLEHQKIIFSTIDEEGYYINIGEHIYIENIPEQDAKYPMLAHINYIIPFCCSSPEKNQIFRIGIELKEALEKIKILPFTKIYTEERFGLEELQNSYDRVTKIGELEFKRYL